MQSASLFASCAGVAMTSERHCGAPRHSDVAATPAEEADNLLSAFRPCIESSTQVATNDVAASRPPKLLQTVEPKSDPQKTGVRRRDVVGRNGGTTFFWTR
uniref:Uncharacterized protein n=1 Tax=Ixodes ricinus TaxID=34613 RepID=A0A6B0UBY2_IXORI